MVSVGEIQTALEQIGLTRMLFELTLLLRSQQPHYRREIIFLVKVEKDLAVMRLLYDDGLRLILAREHRPRRHQGCQEQKKTCDDGGASDQ